jgi:tetratricopeptide (TPR) repeat protein
LPALIRFPKLGGSVENLIVFSLRRPSRFSSVPFASAALLLVAWLGSFSLSPALAQTSSSSSSNPDAGPVQTTPVPRVVQPEAAGSAITLETSESLFYLAASLNACGYDNGLPESSPLRLKIRDEMNQELAASEEARNARDPLCAFIREHALNDRDRTLAQYVSLSLYLNPPPALTLSIDESDLPPDSAEVTGILPLVRTFAEAIHLNASWVAHRPDYQAFIERIHDPMTSMVLNTNLFLHMPTSSYDGRRFMVVLEPMLPPSQTNARIYGSDYVIVVSPSAQGAAVVPMDLIRHTYLHYLIEPMLYSRAKNMDRFLPLLKPVQDAPLEFTYKADIVALMTECLIKAVEVQLMDVGFPHPAKPAVYRDRSDQDRFEFELAAYDRKAEAVRRKAVDIDMRQGWILVEYFYNQLSTMDKSGTSLKDEIGPMVYGMEIERERHHAEQIAFLPTGSGGDPAFRIGQRRTRQIAGIDLGEMKLVKGDINGAGEIAEAALKTNPDDARAHYLLGRTELMQGHPDEALQELTETVRLSKDPRTTAWAHIYLGRMYDIAQTPQRDKAIAEYRAALANRDSQPDTKSAAEKGLKEPFALPKRATVQPDESGDNAPLDPTGKAEKEAYRPTQPK